MIRVPPILVVGCRPNERHCVFVGNAFNPGNTNPQKLRSSLLTRESVHQSWAGGDVDDFDRPNKATARAQVMEKGQAIRILGTANARR